MDEGESWGRMAVWTQSSGIVQPSQWFETYNSGPSTSAIRIHGMVLKEESSDSLVGAELLL